MLKVKQPCAVCGRESELVIRDLKLTVEVLPTTQKNKFRRVKNPPQESTVHFCSTACLHEWVDAIVEEN